MSNTITIHRVCSEIDHEVAVKRLIELAQTDLREDSDAWEEFHAITALVREWEKPLYEERPKLDPVDTILFYMDQNNLKQKAPCWVPHALGTTYPVILSLFPEKNPPTGYHPAPTQKEPPPVKETALEVF